MNLTDEIRELLKQHPHTMSQLSEALGMNYYTVRKYMKPLIETGVVIKYDRAQRNVRYTIGEGQTNSIIPELNYKANLYKANKLTDYESMRELNLNLANKLMSSLAAIFKAAQKLENDSSLGDIESYLARARTNLRSTRTDYENLVLLTNQIIENERFWNPIYLEKFSSDQTWETTLKDVEALIKEYRYDG